MSRLFLLLALLFPLVATAATITGRVVGVSDGDTITVLDDLNTQHKIRLAGIDAPEKAQPYGQKAKESLGEIVSGKVVTVEFDKLDRYGRKVGKVLLDGKDVNLEQIRRGLAWHYKAYENEQLLEDRRRYASMEVTAQLGKVGLWRDAEPMPPWEFRRTRRRD